MKTARKTANHIEMQKGSPTKITEKFGKQSEDDPPTSKKRNRDALSPLENTDARRWAGVSKVRRREVIFH